MKKLVVITGASRGLGLITAKEFAANNWQVAGTGRSEQSLDFPTDATYHRFDASNATESESFWGHLKEEYPEAQICLVNNAGGYVSGSLIETKAEAYATQIQSSYFSAVYMTRGLALNFSKARIINIVSTSALAAHKNNSAYGAAKAAEMHFFQSLQEEFKPAQYQITNLYPSDIATHGADPDAIKPEDLARFVREQADNESTYYLRDVTVYPVGLVIK
ncbi:MAG TPA: SDR family oxidoreductase [Patescibacteria group bacterium]|jgi:NAD(P)-dependent dehydrogenase (short-subunit alcohol dehydrogenase family)|nr:SDR family oxidoreductase [Patescibacteria group bacterium]